MECSGLLQLNNNNNFIYHWSPRSQPIHPRLNNVNLLNMTHWERKTKYFIYFKDKVSIQGWTFHKCVDRNSIASDIKLNNNVSFFFTFHVLNGWIN